MKKRTIIALIVAVALIVVGGMILVLGLSFAGEGATQTGLTEQRVVITETFDSILIETGNCAVNFEPFNGSKDPYVDLREREKTRHSVLVEDGVLKIKMTDNRRWMDYIGIFGMGWERMEMTVHLPQKQYESLRITTDTGDIQIPEALVSKEILLRSSTGDIDCEGTAIDLLDCMTSTGDLFVRDGAPVLTKLQSSTGDLSVSGSMGKQIHMKTSTGEVNAENVETQSFTCSSSTGEVELERVLVEDYLQVFTTTGDVGIEDCDAGRVNIKTDTGDVNGHFLSPKWFDAHSDTGNVMVPDGRDGGECRIQSDTGNIHFK